MNETMSDTPRISLIVPVYKEEDNIGPFLARVEPILAKIGAYEILFCLDPSPDKTEEVIRKEIERNPNIGLILMSRRFGQPSATMAGILNCRGEACAVIDVDLQDPPELIPEMYAKLSEGYDVAYARRRSRQGETWLKLVVSWVGYKFINFIADVDIPRNTGDFRVMTRRVIEELRKLPERHGFLRGLVAYVGFKQIAVDYDRDPRLAGEGKYNRFLGSMKIAFNGIIGFSTTPLSMLLWGGCFIAFLSAILAFVMVFHALIAGVKYPLGVPTITVLVLFLGGVQLVGIGLLGEYIGRIYEEVRHRPRYIVDRKVNVPGPAASDDAG